MRPFKLVVLLLCALLLGYAAAYIPALQLPVLQTIHRWRPPSNLGSSAAAALQVQGIGWVGTRTRYFQESITFFRDVLHIPLTIESAGFVEFELAGGERLGIFRPTLPGTSFMKGPMMEFLVADVAQARQSLESVGVRFIGPIQRNEASGLTWTEFWGPDGYPYGLTSVSKQP